MKEHRTPLVELGLSTRPYNALMRAGITTVDELRSLSLDQIKEFRYIGEKSIAEIKYHLENIDNKNTSLETENLKIRNSSNDLKDKSCSEVVDANTPIERLGLPARILHALDREGITTAGELASIPNEQLSRIRNIGRKSVAEIQYLLESLDIDISSTELNEEIIQSLPDNSEKNPPSAGVYENIPIRYLEFSNRICHILERNGISTIGDLVSHSNSQLLNIKQLGKKSLAEIEHKLQQILDHPGYSPTLSEYIGEDIEELGEMLCNQIPVNRIALPKVLEQKLIDLDIAALGQLLGCPLIKLSILGEGDLELITQRLTFYLGWIRDKNALTWEGEISGRDLPHLFRTVLRKLTISDLIMKSLSLLPERGRQILIWRYGIDGNRLSLREAGDNLGITRERVRQLQSQFLRRLQLPENSYGGINFLAPFVEYLERLINSNHGIVNDEELIEIVERDEIAGFGDKDPRGMLDFICEIDSKFRYEKRMHYISLASYSTDEIISVLTQLRSILEEERTPTSQENILAKFKKTSYFKQRNVKRSNEFILACLKVDPEIEQQENDLFALEKWSSTRLDEMIMVLRDIGHPAHYSEITRKINQLFPLEQRTTPRNIHGHLSRLPEIFIRVGHGVFGLSEWGLFDDGNLANAAYRVIKEVGRPLHIDTITERVLITWRVRPESVYAAIQNDERFVRIGTGVYYLRELPLIENDTPKVDFDELFGEQLEQWHKAFEQQERNLEVDPYIEVEKLNDMGLDFFNG
jgi:DNA-directed RNA polymerase alpha subunit